MAAVESAQISELLAQASQLEEDGALDEAGEVYLKAFAEFSGDELVQAEFARHFVRYQLGRLVQDDETRHAVAIAFEALGASNDVNGAGGAGIESGAGDDISISDTVLLEQAVFQSQIAGDLDAARQTFELGIGT
jgi:hypothetical protein